MAAPLLALTDLPLATDALVQAVAAEHAARAAARDEAGAGAFSTFIGTVRDRNRGQRVQRLEYEAYAPLAVRTFEQIRDEAAALWPSVVLGIHHRTGTLQIGEASVVIVAASAHRAQACAASRYAIERIKQIAPIWKHEYIEGGDAWIEGAVADANDDRAREEARRLACA
jgi:molybdopterin synthase catalytic subunit